MKRFAIKLTIWSLFICLAFGVGIGVGNSSAAEAQRGYQHVVVFSDIHLPGKNLAGKEKALATINSWPDVDLVVMTGDTVATSGDSEQYGAAKQFFSKLTKPACFIGGNHEYIYPDGYPINPATGHHLKEASPEMRAKKIERFKETWGLKEIFYSRRAGNYLLVFLTPDGLHNNNYAEMTSRQLEWLSTELQNNRNLPTIVFFHAPLAGTYSSVRITRSKNPDSQNAEPADRIRTILKENPQVFMWVAGHLHLSPLNKDFKSPQNLYEDQVMVIHCPDMNGSSVMTEKDLKATSHDAIWTNSLLLYPEVVVVRTYDHKQGFWIKDLDRVVFPNKN